MHLTVQIEWVYRQASQQPWLAGVVGGLDLTKHDMLKENIVKFSKHTRPRFVGVGSSTRGWAWDSLLTLMWVSCNLQVFSLFLFNSCE